MDPARRNAWLAAAALFAAGTVPLVACGGDDAGTVHGAVYGDAGADGAVSGGGDDASGGGAGDDAASGGDARPVEGGGGDGGPGCTEQIAVLGGGAASAFFASSSGLSAWTTSTIPGSVAAAPALATFGPTGFTGAYVGTDGVLRATSGNLSAQPARATPALVPIATTLHLLYQGTDFKYWHGTLTGATWDAANDPVGGSGAAQSFGPQAASGAAAGGKLVAVQVGDDGKLYAQTLDGTWQAAVDTGARAEKTVPPRVVAMNGGTAELMAVFVTPGQFKLTSVTRTGGTWSFNTLMVDPNAYTSEPFTLAALGGGRAILAWRGADGRGYTSRYTPATSSWSAPAAVSATTTAPSVASAPAVIAGICGADAIAAYAESGAGGSAKIASLTGATWSSPIAVPGTSTASWVTVATRP